MFNEICIYEVKEAKEAEFLELLREVCDFYKAFPGVVDVKYIKRTHRQKDFNAVKAGEPPIRLTRFNGKLTYMLYLSMVDENAHGDLAKVGLEKFYKRWTRCLTTMPKIYLGETVVE